MIHKDTSKEAKVQKNKKYNRYQSHIKELKLRLVLSILTIISIMICTLLLSNKLFAFIADPLIQSMLNHSMPHQYAQRMIYTNLTEGMTSYLSLSFKTALIISFPIISFNIYSFVAPGLYKHERRLILPYLIFSQFLFLCGTIFVYYLVMPATWQFFMSFQGVLAPGIQITLEPKISEYLDLFIEFILAFGFAFQLPVVLALLTHTSILNVTALSHYRRHAIVAIFTLAAILTPPDVVSQIALALPMILLYEISILICKGIEKQKQKNL